MGEEWQADQYYSGGRTYTNASGGIGNTDKDDLFYTERYGEFSYDIPVPATGIYAVELHFAEIHWTRENARVKLYPNPASDRVRLEFYAEETGELDFVLVNSSGTATHLANLNLEIGEYLLEFELSQYSLSAGTYYVQIVNQRGVLTTKE